MTEETIQNYKAGSDYYPFGMLQPGRQYNVSEYEYGFNGKLMDDEWNSSSGTMYDYGDRMYDPRVGRWFKPDLFEPYYPQYSTYSYALDNPIIFIDADGNIIVGLDGNPVYYFKMLNGEIWWSSNASADVKKIGEIMLKKPNGEKDFKAMQDMPTKIELKLVDDMNRSEAGLTTGNPSKLTPDGFFEKALVEINTAKLNDPKYDYSTEEELILATTSHESWELEPKQMELNKNIPQEIVTVEDKEKYYRYHQQQFSAEYSAREEYWSTRMGPEPDWKSWYVNTETSTGINKPSYTGIDQQSMKRTINTTKNVIDNGAIKSTLHSITRVYHNISNIIKGTTPSKCI